MNDYDPLDLSKNGSLIVILGPSGTGKSHMVKYLISKWYEKNLFDYYYIMSGSSFSGNIDYIDEQYQTDFSAKKLEKFIEISKKMSKDDKKGCLILDDVGGARNIFEKDSIVKLWSNFRHHKLTIVFACQYASQIPPVLRINVFIYIVFDQKMNKASLKYLKEAVCIGEEKKFEELLNIIHDVKKFPHTALVVDKVRSEYKFMRAPKNIPKFFIELNE